MGRTMMAYGWNKLYVVGGTESPGGMAAARLELDFLDHLKVTIHDTDVPHTIDIGGPYSVTEGGTVALDASASTDPGGGTPTFLWDLDGDGRFGETGSGAVCGNEVGPNPTLDASGLDGPGQWMVRLELRGSDGSSQTATTMISVVNTPPTLIVVGNSTADTSTPYQLDFSAFDPGPDTVYSWHFDWGDENDDTVEGYSSGGISHAFTTPGTYVINASATDEDGTYPADPLTVVVSGNGVPLVNAGSDATIDEGGTFTGGGSFVDVDSSSWTATVDYGDDTGLQSLTLNGDKTFSLSHQYADNGVYAVTVTVTDSQGSPGTDIVHVTVDNVAPILTISGPSSVEEDTAFSLSLSVSDPGDDAVYRWNINWGDGQTYTLNGNPSNTSHSYANPGSYQITATATDEDGTFSANSISVQVDEAFVPPPGYEYGNEGDSFSYN
jgi:hypothetical protein